MRKLLPLHARDHRLDGADPIPDPSWIYVGTYPTDPNTTVDSPPFQNSWANLGGNYPPLRFKKDIAGFVCLEGAMDGGANGSIAFTLPTGHRPERSLRFLGSVSTGSDFVTLQVDPTGDVIVVATGYTPGDGSITPGKISTAGGTNGDVLQIISGAAVWAADPGGNVTYEHGGAVVAAEPKLNLIDGDAISLTVADDVANSRVGVTVAVAPGTNGQVLKTVSGHAAWANEAPQTSVQHGESTVGTRSKIDLNDGALVGWTVTDDPADDEVDVTAVIVPGTNGQVLQTVGGAAAWGDVKKHLVLSWFGSLPVSTGSVSQVLRIPYLDGVSVTFNLTRLSLRIETAGSTATSITLQKSPGGGSFVPTSIGTASVASSVNEDDETAGLGSVTSGDLVRIDWTALGTGAASYNVEMEATQA